MKLVTLWISILLLSPLHVAHAWRNARELSEIESETNVVWESTSPRIFVDASALPVSADSTAASVQRAMQAWSESACSSFRWASNYDRESADVTVMFHRDGWREMGFPRDSLAVTTTNYEGDERAQFRIVSASIDVDAENHRWAPVVATEGQRRIDAVLAHELGHAAGFLHPCGDDGLPECTQPTVMDPFYSTSVAPALSEDDEAGLCAVYPADTTASPPPVIEPCVGCVASFGEPCSRGADCDSGVCLIGDSSAFCSMSCDAGCPEGFRCGLGDERVCVPSTEGCSAGGAGGGSAASLALLMFVAVRFRSARGGMYEIE